MESNEVTQAVRNFASTARRSGGPRVHLHYLSHQGFHFTPTDATEKSARRFENFMGAVIHCPVRNPLEPAALVIACALAFELLEYDDLPEFLSRLNQLQTYGDSAYATWTVNDRVQRRAVCAFTLIAHSKLPTVVDWSQELPNAIPTILKLYDFADLPKPGQTLKSIFFDLQAWIYLQMPMSFLSHHVGCVRATLLPESAWQRRFDTNVPSCSAQEKTSRAELTEEIGAVMETYLEAAPALSGAWFVEELSSICKGLTGSTVSLKDSTVWKELLIRFKSLSTSLRQAGPNEALLTGWAIHVAQVGTIRKKNPRLSRLSGYLTTAAKRMHLALRSTGRHPEELTTQEWDKLYRSVLAHDQKNGTLRAAVASFHSYLCITLDTEPLRWLHKSLERNLSPRANCIWKHEIARLPNAIDQSTNDLRLRDQVKTWGFLLPAAPIRFGELKWIRHKDIIPFSNHIQIHLANQAYVGSGKTRAADRLIFIHDENAVRALKGWLTRPEFKGAKDGDFIFAAPDDPRKIYRIGQAYALLNRCLKEVTGSSEFSIHLCRHTSISLAIERALYAMVEFHEINPIHEVQVQAGHQSSETTWRTYFHLLEDAMRFWHDRALRRIKISYRAAQWWSGEEAINLRQAVHRGKEKLLHVFDAINNAARVHLPATSRKTGNFRRTEFTQPVPERPAMDVVISILADLFSEVDIATTISRRGVTSACVRSIIDIVGAAALRISGADESNKSAPTDSLALEIALSIASRINLDFSRLSKANWKYSRKLVEKLDYEELHELTDAWLDLARFGNINAPESPRTSQMVKGLHLLGIPADRVTVRINPHPRKKKHRFCVPPIS